MKNDRIIAQPIKTIIAPARRFEPECAIKPGFGPCDPDNISQGYVIPRI